MIVLGCAAALALTGCSGYSSYDGTVQTIEQIDATEVAVQASVVNTSSTPGSPTCTASVYTAGGTDIGDATQDVPGGVLKPHEKRTAVFIVDVKASGVENISVGQSIVACA